MNRSKVEWTDYTWNPVTGCLHGCPYCYAKRQARRFSGDTRMNIDRAEHWQGCKDLYVLHETFSARNGRVLAFPYGFSPTLHEYRLEWPCGIKQGANIFVCSMADLFGIWVPDEWIETVFAACKKYPQHNYLFLTKNPQRYADLDDAGKLPQDTNFWYGATASDAPQMEQAADAMGQLPEKSNTFLSAEPLLEDITATGGWACARNGRYFNWIITGAETGNRKGKVAPQRAWIDKLNEDCMEAGTPFFMKDSLSSLMGKDLVQEFPVGLQQEKQLTAKQKALLWERCGLCKMERPKKTMTALLTRAGRGQSAFSSGYLCPSCLSTLQRILRSPTPMQLGSYLDSIVEQTGHSSSNFD